MIPEDAWPAGDLIEWDDDVARVHHDFLNETQRLYTDDENAAADERQADAVADRNEQTLRAQAALGLAGNKTFLALTAPTNAQHLAQVKALTKQMNCLIRLAVGDLSSTDGTTIAKPSGGVR